jgi:hypothetical protein
MPYSSHPPLLDHSNYTLRSVQVMKLLIIQFSPNPLSGYNAEFNNVRAGGTCGKIYMNARL